MSVRYVYYPEVIKAWATVHFATIDPQSVFDGDASENEGYLESPLNKYVSPWRPSPSETDTDEVPEIAGRICYQSFSNPRPGGNKAYLKRILSEGHGNVLEHSTVGFILFGVSRSLTHELIRHRAGVAVSEMSQRYVDAVNLRFVIPPRYKEIGDDIPISFTRLCERAAYEYRQLVDSENAAASTIERKRIREAARSVLPNCAETHIAVTGNLRAWRNILEQRGDSHADLEIRRLAAAIVGHLKEAAPNSFQDMAAGIGDDGFPIVTSEHRKV